MSFCGRGRPRRCARAASHPQVRATSSSYEVAPLWRTGWLRGGGAVLAATVPVVLDVDGGPVVQARVEPVGVEPSLDPTDDGAAGVGPGGPPLAVSELAFERPE